MKTLTSEEIDEIYENLLDCQILACKAIDDIKYVTNVVNKLSNIASILDGTEGYKRLYDALLNYYEDYKKEKLIGE